MIFVDTKSNDPYINLATEYYIATNKDFGETIFMLWANKPTLVVGKFQNTVEEINEEYVKNHDIKVIRRMSGGGTVYHDLGGRQFTFIARGAGMKISFKEYLDPIVNVLRTLGVEACMTGRNDLTVNGKKISGNAQYKIGDITVHHGTLLFDTDIEAVVHSTNVDPYKIISKSIKSVRERVTNIKDHLPTEMTVEAFDKYIINAVCPEGKEYILTDDDREKIEKIADEKFRGNNNIYGNNPKYQVEKTGRFAGGKVTVRLDIKKGTITGAKIYGDFFASENVIDIEKALLGCKLGYDDVYSALKNAVCENTIYSVTLDELAHLVSEGI